MATMTEKALRTLSLGVKKTTPELRAWDRQMWILRQIGKNTYKSLISGDEAFVKRYVAKFPEAENTLRIYTMGADVSPMLNRDLAKLCKDGWLKKGSIGNQDARSYNQRTWARTYRLTDAGIDLVITARCEACQDDEKIVTAHPTRSGGIRLVPCPRCAARKEGEE